MDEAEYDHSEELSEYDLDRFGGSVQRNVSVVWQIFSK